MLTYNYIFGQINKNLAIYRIQDRVDQQQTTGINNIDSTLTRFLQVISSKSAIYSFKQSIHSSLNLTGYTHMTSPIRRLVDLIGQEIYYTGSSLFISKNPNILDSINLQSKAIKYLERDINKLKLAHMVYTSANNKYITHCYVYKVDIDKNKKYIYFPRENISIVDTIINSSLIETTDIFIENSYLIINNDAINQTIKLNSLLEVYLYGNPNLFNIDKSLLISF
jgi:exoribonuclease R